MEKVKLIRRGRLVGLVGQNFHRPELQKDRLWEKLEIRKI